MATTEPIQIVEILQPLCSRTFGTSPCLATGTKCYNTRATCRYPSAYALDTPLSLYFSKGTVGDRSIDGYVIPSLVSVSTSATQVNLAVADSNSTGLGNRSVINVVFNDHPHTDRIVDPYLSSRTFNPCESGSFWTKWMARNKYRTNIVIKVYEGKVGDALVDMTERTYFIEEISGPTSSGKVTIKAKDILARTEERKAKAPVASPGVLYTDITAAATSIEVANALVSEYDSSGLLRIDDELISYSSVTTSTNGITFTVTSRGAYDTTAATHETDETVQQCLVYDGDTVDDVVYDLLVNYAGISASYLDYTNWQSEVTDYLAIYEMFTIISEPTSVAQLVNELCEQALFYMWWDEYDALVKLKAIHAIDVSPETISEDENIIAGTMSITEDAGQRISQSWFYYNPRSWVESLTDANNFKNLYISADLDSETDEKYGSPQIKQIFSRWFASSVLAITTTSKLIVRYATVPRKCSFKMDIKDKGWAVGDIFYLDHYLDVNALGEKNIAPWMIISTKESVQGEIIDVIAQDISSYGGVYVICPDGTLDWQGDGTDYTNGAYIGNASGLLSDGTGCATLS